MTSFRSLRSEFHFPQDPKTGAPLLYFCGNSLGLQPKKAAQYLQEELEDWAKLGVEGHLEARRPWKNYHEFFTEGLARIVGAKPQEVVAMGTLTANLHSLMISFYRPSGKRTKILIEKSAFPSDQYAVASQLRLHGLDPKEHLLEWTAPQGEVLPRMEDLQALLQAQGEQIALILLGGVNYYTGQWFDIPQITQWAHEYGIVMGVDLAHAAGNMPLALHDWGVDFAAWCHYKYLNSGPGSIAGLFVHERHLAKTDLPRLEGWWGHDKATRFQMPDQFQPMPTAEAWQMSNAPVFSMAPLLASLELFEAAGGMAALRQESLRLTAELWDLLSDLPKNQVRIITPAEPEQRGCQLSLQIPGGNKSLFQRLTVQGVIADWREPDVIRIAPVPLYNNSEDLQLFVQKLRNCLG